MKKLNLHHFHHEEIEKQQQNLLTGGEKDYCICTGVLCGCFCGESDPSRQLNLEDGISLTISDLYNGGPKAIENTDSRTNSNDPM